MQTNALDKQYDYLKHVTTISAGSLVLLTTFADKFAKNAEWRLLLPVSVVGFLICLLSSLFCMFSLIVFGAYGSGKVPKKVMIATAVSLVVAGFALFAGFASLGVFAIRNF